MGYTEERLEVLERAVGQLQQRMITLEGARREPTPTRPAAPASFAPTPTRDKWQQSPAPAAQRGSTAPPTAPAPPKRTIPTVDLESLLTGRVLAWAGALAVLAGLIFFLVTALNRGWIDEPTRVFLAFIGSTALLSAGMFLHERRDQTQASVAMVATAIAGLFFSTTAATTLYHLISPDTGLLLAGLIGAVAAGVAVRWESREIAAIGIVGALLAPVLVHAGDSDASLGFMVIALIAATAVLLWMRWDWLATAAFLISVPQLLYWMFDHDGQTAATALPVLVVFWVIYVVAAIGFEVRVPTAQLRFSSASLLLANALLIAAAGWSVIHETGDGDGATFWIIGVAAAHVLLGATALRGKLSREISLLLLAVGIGLSAVGLAMALSGPALVAAWCAEAVLLAWLSGRMGLTRGYAAAAGFLAAAAIHVVSIDAPLEELGQALGGSAVMATILVAVAAALVSRLYEGEMSAYRDGAEILALAAVAYLAPVAADGVWVVAIWAATAALAAELTHHDEIGLDGTAPLAFIALATGHTLAVEAPPLALVDGVADLGSAVLAITMTAAAACFAAYRESGAPRSVLSAFTALALVYLGSVVIVDVSAGSGSAPGQTPQVLLSVFWAAVGFGGLVYGLIRSDRGIRLGGLGLLALSAAKVVFYDLAALDEIYRVLSFVGLGLLLLAGAYAEQRIRRETEDVA